MTVNLKLRPRKLGQEKQAWMLSRLSPALVFQLAAMALAETGTRTKARYEDAMFSYREQFDRYTIAKRIAPVIRGVSEPAKLRAGAAPRHELG